ncbi:glucosaminidase domain-containing protein [Loigolactobacillus zhaoyuanensis]|uniref:glucosaminidase domain-containing protein n=1 Tax=Loigolactobacillus zhaoyuanensis TaxID=2486017 RepID=UPI000F743F89|nr:glucosaminidase domain-containing protein [Loigolactobacillus zhaoyuanensis]
MTQKNVKFAQRAATVALSSVLLSTPILTAVPSLVHAVATVTSTEQTTKNAAQLAAQQDVLAGNDSGTSLDPNGDTTYQADYAAEFTHGQQELKQGQVAADQDVTDQQPQNTSKPATATIYYNQGYDKEYAAALTAFKAGITAGHTAGYAQKAVQIDEQLGAIYRAGYKVGYAQGQAQQQAEANAAASQAANSQAPATSQAAKPVTSQAAQPAASTGSQTTSQASVATNNTAEASSTATSIATPAPNNNNGFSNDLTTADDSWLYPTGTPVASHSEFIKLFAKDAQKIAQAKGLYASVMIAQAALESNWGTSTLSLAPNYNLFGVKGSYQGHSALMATQEDNGFGQLYTINSNFKRYGDYKDSLVDYATLLRGGPGLAANYYAGTWKQNAKTYQAATKVLTGRYATDTKYNLKLNQIIATYHLTTYDQAPTASQTPKQVNFTATLKQRPQLKQILRGYFLTNVQPTQLNVKSQLLRTPIIWRL